MNWLFVTMLLIILLATVVLWCDGEMSDNGR